MRNKWWLSIPIALLIVIAITTITNTGDRVNDSVERRSELTGGIDENIDMSMEQYNTTEELTETAVKGEDDSFGDSITQSDLSSLGFEQCLSKLIEQYGTPEQLTENTDTYDEGLTICCFPDEGIVIILKTSENAALLNAWEINDSNAINDYVMRALRSEAVKTVYVDFSDLSAKQYPDDFSSASFPNAVRYNEYEQFLLSLMDRTNEKDKDDIVETDVPAQSTVKNVQKATAKPTRKPTAKPQGTPVITISPTRSPSWGNWSEWSTTKAMATDTCQVETRTETKTKVQYTYKHWHYTHKENGPQNSYAEYKGSKYVEGSGKWEYYRTDTPLKQTDTKDGYKRYKVNGVSWYWETKNETVEEITYYRYRELQK